MHITLDCPGCGRRLFVNKQFAGRTVRCPSCGAAYTAPAPRDAPARRGRSAFDDASTMDMHVPCERCGMLVRANGDGGPATCANCREASGPDVFRLADSAPTETIFSAPNALSPPSSPAVKAEPAPGLAAPPSPSPIPATTESQCPECSGAMALDGVVCISCGFNRATGKRLKTVTQRIARRWDAGNFPLLARIVVLGCLVSACFLPAVLFRYDADELAWRLLIPAAAAPLGALLLGTFHRITVTTDPHGTPLLIQNSWICFVPSSTFNLDLSDFRTVRLTHRESSPGPMGLLLALGLCMLGGLPAILFRMHLLHGNLFTLDIVSRPDVDGQPLLEPFTVYHGRSERMARGIGDALEQIGGLRYG